MAKYKSYNYSQTEMVPVSLEDQLMEGTLELVIHRLVEGRMGVSCFDERYKNDETSCKAPGDCMLHFEYVTFLRRAGLQDF